MLQVNILSLNAFFNFFKDLQEITQSSNASLASKLSSPKEFYKRSSISLRETQDSKEKSECYS